MKQVKAAIGAILYASFFAAFCISLLPFALLSIPLYYLGIPRVRFGKLWYNLDRALASGLWGTSQETISSQVGRIAIGAGKPDGWTPRWKFEARWTKAVARWLNTDTRIWGVNHCATAIQHADQLDHADDGKEQ